MVSQHDGASAVTVRHAATTRRARDEPSVTAQSIEEAVVDCYTFVEASSQRSPAPPSAATRRRRALARARDTQHGFHAAVRCNRPTAIIASPVTTRPPFVATFDSDTNAARGSRPVSHDAAPAGIRAASSGESQRGSRAGRPLRLSLRPVMRWTRHNAAPTPLPAATARAGVRSSLGHNAAPTPPYAATSPIRDRRGSGRPVTMRLPRRRPLRLCGHPERSSRQVTTRLPCRRLLRLQRGRRSRHNAAPAPPAATGRHSPSRSASGSAWREDGVITAQRFRHVITAARG
jgi:hypothetical protein